jgi:hypothetical protein
MAKHSMTMEADPNSIETKLLEARITLALENAPGFEIPDDFAAKVAAQVRPLPIVAAPRRRYGRIAAVVSMASLLGLMLAFADRSAGTSAVWTTAEWIFCVQFLLVGWWLAGSSGNKSRI